MRRSLTHPRDEIVDENGLRNVFAAWESPESSEGFADVIAVHASDI
jgi:hypothetical protein